MFGIIKAGESREFVIQNSGILMIHLLLLLVVFLAFNIL